MPRIKRTKSELKQQRELLKRFQRYLPTLQLKKQQLQGEVRRVQQERAALERERKRFRVHLEAWIAVFGETRPLAEWLHIRHFEVGHQNIAGVDVPVLNRLDFDEQVPARLEEPLWIDEGLVALRRELNFELRLRILRVQEERLLQELRTTNQRVNLFEKVRIPQCRENIRVIRIALGDEQVAAVARGKLAKARSPSEDDA